MFQRALLHLRKSRTDLEAEALGEGETLAKHEKFLCQFAKEHKINIVCVRRELESGESLVHRPEMLLTLQEVEQGLYDGVICMDLDRLGRGDMQDQGLILTTFKKSGTKIITPRKVYDLNDEWDEEYSEFEAFMARKELKYINRRLQRGRIASVSEGNYLCAVPPYGYLIEQKGKERYLVPHPEQAPVVRMIFEWYTQDDAELRMGTRKISNELNRLGIPSSKGGKWLGQTIAYLLKKIVYIGYIQYKKREIKKSVSPGKQWDTRTRPQNEIIEVIGKHQALISEEVFQKAKGLLAGQNRHVPTHKISNPLAGLIYCDICGASMIMQTFPSRPHAHIKCYRNCGNKSARHTYVEQKLLAGLGLWLKRYQLEQAYHTQPLRTEAVEFRKKALSKLKKDLQEYEKQKANLHNFLERGIYTVDTYLERSAVIAEQLQTIRVSIKESEMSLEVEIKRQRDHVEHIPQVEQVLDLYSKITNPGDKNTLLKTAIEYAVYRKEKDQKHDAFTLEIYPKLPK
ncbi:MAG: recombinase family protein [Carboxydocellales bacterium]